MRTKIGFRILLLSLIIGLLLTGCDESVEESATRGDCVPYHGFSVCGPILDFYRQHGEAAVFGYPIANQRSQGNMVIQYFARVVVQYPAADPRLEKVHLRPLGLEMSSPTPPENRRDDPDCRYFEHYGHYVCHEYLDFFERIGGEQVLGQPVSTAKMENGISIQDFENGRLKWVTDPGPPHVELESWGEVACRQDEMGCFGGDDGHAEVAPIIDQFVETHGGTAIFGNKVGDLVRAGDVAYQYFENACLIWTPGGAQGVTLAPLGRLDAPQVPRVDPPAPSNNIQYFADSGHTVIMAFLDFYRQRQGQTVFGLPLTEFVEKGNLGEQWFENVLLEWRPNAPDGQRVRLAPLGEINYQKYNGALPPTMPQATQIEQKLTRLPEDIHLRVMVKNPILPLGESQMIHLRAEDSAGRPLADVSITLYVITSSSQQIHTAPPTDADGSAWVALENVSGDCGEMVQLRAVAETSDSMAVANDYFALWCDPN